MRVIISQCLNYNIPFKDSLSIYSNRKIKYRVSSLIPIRNTLGDQLTDLINTIQTTLWIVNPVIATPLP